MSLDYPEYEKLRKQSCFLGLLWRIGDLGYYLGLFGRVNASSYQRIFETPSSRKSGVEI